MELILSYYHLTIIINIVAAKELILHHYHLTSLLYCSGLGTSIEQSSTQTIQISPLDFPRTRLSLLKHPGVIIQLTEVISNSSSTEKTCGFPVC